MKPIFILLTTAICITACSKQNEIISEKPVERSITYLHRYYNANNEYVKTDTAWHRCFTCCENLTRWESYPKITPYCDNNDILELVIAERCKTDCPNWDDIPDLK